MSALLVLLALLGALCPSAWADDGDGPYARALGWLDLLGEEAAWRGESGSSPFALGWYLEGADARSGERAVLAGDAGSQGPALSLATFADLELTARVALVDGGALFLGQADGAGVLLADASPAPPGAVTLVAGGSHRVRLVVRERRERVWIDGRLVRERQVAAGAGPQAVRVDVHGPGGRVYDLHARDPSLNREAPNVLSAAPGLPGWTELGDALWSGDGRAITGRVGGGGQSFLMSEQTFGDFVFEVDVLVVGDGNSGIQIRSHVNDQGRLSGYQVEIDPSARAWSAGIYDEARRGWLDDLSDNDAARASFRRGAWNRYRIAAVGPRLRTWINGVPAADLLDPLDMGGHVALQVHSGRNTHVRWRDLRMRDLGQRSWEPVEELSGTRLEDGAVIVDLAPACDDGALRIQVKGVVHVLLRHAGAPADVTAIRERDGELTGNQLTVLPDMWWVRLVQGSSPSFRPYTICFVDDRVSVFDGDERILDLRDPSATRAGGLSAFMPAGQATGLELVGSPR